MILGWNADHDELRRVVRRFLRDKSGSEAVRAAADAGASGDPVVWRQMAGQLGLQGLTIPEEFGGQGMGAIELGVVMEELGRVLYVGPFLSTVGLAASALQACGDKEIQREWLPRIADGSATATIAVMEPGVSGFRLDNLRTTATSDEKAPGGWRLTGTKVYVVDGVTADAVIVAATDGDEVGMFVVDRTVAADHATMTMVDNLDITRSLATLELSGAPAQRAGGDAIAAWSRTGDLGCAALAAEQAGGAAAALNTAVEYARQRVQFGRPIGSFQAIKHTCADIFVANESARSAAFFAAALLGANDPEGPVSASVAKAWCSSAYIRAAKANIQIHGGLGFTWEHDAHLHLRRAKVSELLMGSPAEHRRRIADLVGI